MRICIYPYILYMDIYIWLSNHPRNITVNRYPTKIVVCNWVTIFVGLAIAPPKSVHSFTVHFAHLYLYFSAVFCSVRYRLQVVFNWKARFMTAINPVSKEATWWQCTYIVHTFIQSHYRFLHCFCNSLNSYALWLSTSEYSVCACACSYVCVCLFVLMYVNVVVDSFSKLIIRIWTHSHLHSLTIDQFTWRHKLFSVLNCA